MKPGFNPLTKTGDIKLALIPRLNRLIETGAVMKLRFRFKIILIFGFDFGYWFHTSEFQQL